ncbi:hypothetical protein DFH28DRAFT_1081572 [Melampsora americana]|nr:hypothetical protein DFH28DRAFT_1081572 [Melampsora americana]
MVPIRKQPPRNSKLGIKVYSNQSKILFAAIRRKHHQKAMSCGLPNFDKYLQRHSNCDRSKLTASKRLQWKHLNCWNKASLAIWRSKKQAENHQHFFYLKTTLADVQNFGSKRLFTLDNCKVAHQFFRGQSNAKQYYEQPEEEKKQWLKEKMFEARNGHDSHNIQSEWLQPY